MVFGSFLKLFIVFYTYAAVLQISFTHILALFTALSIVDGRPVLTQSPAR
jgi:hypothetical protein